MKRNSQMNSRKQEITLMTLLANEAARESAGILQKYNKPKAKNNADLEVKLAELYFEQPDKIQIEKELAEIHPHKKWLVKSLQLVSKDEVKCKKCEETTQKTTETDKLDEIKKMVSESVSKFSDFNGSNVATENTKLNPLTDWLPLIAVVGMVSVTMIIVAKSTK